MLRFGIVTNIDEATAKARVQFAEDDMLSYWLPVLQQKTHKDKFYCLPDIGEQVACLMDGRSEEGVIIGAIYSKFDEVPIFSKDKIHISFEDGAFIEYDKTAKAFNINGKINHNGVLNNSAGINSNSDISDHTSSMQCMRDKYNPHTHTGNQGADTSAPSEVMS